MPLQSTRGAGSAKGFGFTAGGPTGPITARVLLLGGGTGGLSSHLDGGQGGGFTDSSSNTLEVGTYTVTVGAGAPGGARGGNGNYGGNSQASTFTGTGVSLTGAAVTQANSRGANGVNGKSGRNGGAGLTSDITGSTVTYGGGGGEAGGIGYEQSPGGAGGAGGGGTGGKCCNDAGTPGTNGLGGGGGGGGISWCGTVYCEGYNGGNGRVIVSYPVPKRATGGTITISGGFVKHDFQSSGSFVLK
jgi:hypothetical protein